MKITHLVALAALTLAAACDQSRGSVVEAKKADVLESSPTEDAEIVATKSLACETATSCMTQRSRPHTPEEVSGLSIVKAELYGSELRVFLSNVGNNDIFPQATDGSNLKLAWGYAAADVQHPGYFDNRFEWVEPLRHGQNVELAVPVELSKPNSGEALWVAIVQENTFWLHDNGVSAVAADVVDPL